MRVAVAAGAVRMGSEQAHAVRAVTGRRVRKEIQLLLCCARSRMDQTGAERIRTLLGQQIDWFYLVRTALPHGMLPLLYWHMSAICPQAVPKTVLDQLEYQFHTNEQRNVSLAHELLKVLELLKTHQISAIPFKGPVLAASVYGNLALREFADLDIVVRPEDALRAKDLLLAEGYRHRVPLTHSQEVETLRSKYEFCLVRGEGGIAVDLHWGFTRRNFPFPLAVERLENRLERAWLAGTMVVSLAPEDLLLILCVHGSKHRWTRLGWICDIGELVSAHRQIDWACVLGCARQLGAERILLLGLFLAEALLGTALPELIRQRMQAHQVLKSLAGRACENLFGATESLDDGLEQWVFRYRMRERWRDRWPFVLSLVRTFIRKGSLTTLTARDRAFLPLPAFLSFLHYLIRPIRLAGEYVLGPLARSLIAKAQGRRATRTDWPALPHQTGSDRRRA